MNLKLARVFFIGANSLLSILTLQCTMRAITEIIYASGPKQAHLNAYHLSIWMGLSLDS